MVRMPFPQNWMMENVQENPTLDEKQRVPRDVHTNQSIDNNFPTEKSQNHPSIFFIIIPISSQYDPYIVPSHMSFLLALPCLIPNHFKKPSSSPSSPSSGFARTSEGIPGCDSGEDRDEDRRQHHDPHRRQNGCESKWKTDVGPQIEMSSLVLTIQLLGYLIFTHTQNLWKPSERSESGGNNFFFEDPKGIC